MPKWRERKCDMKLGELVILTAPNLAPSYWELGRIIKIFPGRDGLVRTVEIKTSTGTYTRPITKIGRLPIYDDDQNSRK